jgi:hypothetical protein
VFDEGQEALADADIALHRQPAEPDREAENEQIGEHEGGQREAEHRQHHDRAIDPGANLPGGNDSQGNGKAQSDDEGHERQRRRGLEPLSDKLRHRQIGENGDAEIAMQHAPGPGAEAQEEWLVEAELPMDARDVVSGRQIAGDRRRRISRRDVEERENEERHERHDEDRGNEAADDISEHRRLKCRR